MPRWNVSELYFLFVCLRSLWREMKAASEEQHREGESKGRGIKKRKQAADLQSGFKFSDGFRRS